MLESFARHGGFDLTVETKGDLHIDMHHTVEDTGIVLGQAVNKALDGFKGIRRFGAAYIPMDETLTRCALDLSNRPYLIWKVAFARPKVGDMDTELFKEFHHAFAMNAWRLRASGNPLRREQPPYRRKRVQGPGPGPAPGGGAGPQDRRPCPFHQGRALRPSCGA